MRLKTPNLAAELGALIQEVDAADDAAMDADFAWHDRNDGDAARAFYKAVRRLHKLEAELAALWRKAAGDRFVHDGGWRYHH